MEAIKYMTSLLTFYIKGEITTEQNFLKIKFPNTVLALIPLGSRKYNVRLFRSVAFLLGVTE